MIHGRPVGTKFRTWIRYATEYFQLPDFRVVQDLVSLPSVT